MVTMTIFTLLLPLMFGQWGTIPAIAKTNWTLVIALLLSGAVGFGAGAMIYLNPKWEKPIIIFGKPIRDALAYDFYMARLYEVTVVFAVAQGSRLTAWLDRYVVDGLVNFVGVASLFSGESLKYTISGQSRTYLLTLFIGLLLGLAVVSWLGNWTSLAGI
jgi:NAD(P)H-quinone oxidoreductase subunit 5